MRVKTEDRRQAIVAAAMTVFREMGYERASMAIISSRVGGSKATLYSYFKSKEELYAAAMLEAVEEQGLQLKALLTPASANLAETLTIFGAALLRLITSPEILAVTRTAIAEGATSPLGVLLYDQGPRHAWQEMTAYLAHLMAAGALRKADPGVAAWHLKGLLEAGILEAAVYGAPAPFSPEDGAALAVATFLRAYGPV